MVDSSKSIVRRVEESEVVGVDHHIAFYVPDERFGRMQFFRQGSGRFVEDVSEEDMGSCVVEEADELGADA
jgi:hypothetical protein